MSSHPPSPEPHLMRRCLTLLVVLLALPALLAAQARPKLSPVAGVSIGTTRLPQPLVETCGGGSGTYPAVAAQAGLARGSWAAVLHGSAFRATAVADCITILPVPRNGVNRYRAYAAARSNGDAALALQLHYAPVSSFWSAGAGAGRLFRRRRRTGWLVSACTRAGGCAQARRSSGGLCGSATRMWRTSGRTKASCGTPRSGKGTRGLRRPRCGWGWRCGEGVGYDRR